MTLLPIALLLVVVYLLIARKSRVSLFRRLLVRDEADDIIDA